MHPLTRMREQLFLSQSKLADKTGLSTRTIQRAEDGTHLGLDSQQRLCEFFSKQLNREVSLSELGLVSSEELSKLDLFIKQSNTTEPEGEKEDMMERRDMIRTIGIASLTMIVASSEGLNTPAFTETLSRFFSRKHPRLTKVMMAEVEARTRQCWQYLPFIANVVEAGSLVFVEEHLRTLQRLLNASPSPSAEKDLYSCASETAQIAGMLFYSLKQHDGAGALLVFARECAQKAGNDALQAVTLGRLGNFLIDTGRAEEALDPLEQASRLAARTTTATVRSWIAASEADASANLLRAIDCDKALNRAEDIGNNMSSGQNLYSTPFDLSWLDGYKGACYGRLGRSHDARNARNALERALESLDSRCLFRRAPLLRDLAIAHSREKNIDEAYHVAIQAIHLAEQLNAPMELQRVQDFSQQFLTRWKGDQKVKDLNELLQTTQKRLEPPSSHKL